MPSPRGRRRRFPLLFASAAALAVTAFGALPATASADSPAATPTGSAASATGTAKAVAGQVNLDVQLLPGLLGALHLTGPNGIDVPLANLSLGEADAPNASGDAANFTNSVVRLRDNLFGTLNLPAPEANLIDADAASGTARVIPGPQGYTQAYATVANLRLFLPLLNSLPGNDDGNGILKVDLVSAQATCVPGQKPTASAKMPTTIQLLGQDIPVPLTGEVKLDLPGVANIDVQLAPTTTIDDGGASSAVAASINLNVVGLAAVNGSVTLASASCTTPGAAAAGGSGGTSSGPGQTASSSSHGVVGSVTSTSKAKAAAAAAASSAPAALSEKTSGDLAHTGASSSLMPMAIIAVVLVVGGGGLVFFLRKKAAGLKAKE